MRDPEQRRATPRVIEVVAPAARTRMRGPRRRVHFHGDADHLEPLLGEEARSLAYDDGMPVVTTSAGLRVRARFVVVTGGIGTFTPRPLTALAGS